MTHLVFGQPIRQPVHLHSDGRKRSHLRYPLTARTRNTQANNNFRLPDIDTSTPADHHILTSLRPPNPFPAVEPGGITPVNDAVRRAQSKQFAVPNAIPGSVFTPDSQHQETPSSPEPTRHHSHAIAAATGHASLRSSHWASTDVGRLGAASYLVCQPSRGLVQKCVQATDVSPAGTVRQPSVASKVSLVALIPRGSPPFDERFSTRVTRFPRRQKIRQGQPVAPRPICTTSVGQPSAPRVAKQNLFPLT